MTPYRILMIDDDPVFLSTMGRSLQRKGQQVLLADNASTAVQSLHENTIDVVLLDLNLNGESGLELLQRLLDIQPDARIIMLTAYSSIATAVKAIKSGAEDYLCKPVNATEIITLLDKSDTISERFINTEPLTVDRLEWEHLQRILIEHNGNVSATARTLNMHRRTLQRKLQKRPVSK